MPVNIHVLSPKNLLLLAEIFIISYGKMYNVKVSWLCTFFQAKELKFTV
jgi:hypothetical protein